jgi:hypothetical protein
VKNGRVVERVEVLSLRNGHHQGPEVFALISISRQLAGSFRIGSSATAWLIRFSDPRHRDREEVRYIGFLCERYIIVLTEV